MILKNKLKLVLLPLIIITSISSSYAKWYKSETIDPFTDVVSYNAGTSTHASGNEGSILVSCNKIDSVVRMIVFIPKTDFIFSEKLVNTRYRVDSYEAQKSRWYIDISDFLAVEAPTSAIAPVLEQMIRGSSFLFEVRNQTGEYQRIEFLLDGSMIAISSLLNECEIELSSIGDRGDILNNSEPPYMLFHNVKSLQAVANKEYFDRLLTSNNDSENISNDSNKKNKDKSVIDAQKNADEVKILKSMSSLIHQRIRSRWIRPPFMETGIKAQLSIFFLPTGEIDLVQLTKSSGDDVFDQRTLDAVYKMGRVKELSDLDSYVFERNFRKVEIVFNP